MDENAEKKFSFPNSDQQIPGVSGMRNPNPYIPSPQEIREATEQKKAEAQRPTVNILDALQQEKPMEKGERTIRTYQADIADAIKNDNVSMIKIAMSEKSRQDKRGGFDQALGGKKSISNLTIIGAIAVFILLAMASVGGYLIFRSDSLQPVTPQNRTVTTPLIYTEGQIPISVDNRDEDDIERIVVREREAPFQYGDLKSLLFTTGTGTSTRLITTEEFFLLTNSRVSDSLVRALSPNFILGIYAFSPQETFLAFNTTFYDGAFAGMLEWEQTMESDIGKMFINKVVAEPTIQPMATSTTATSTASSTAVQPNTGLTLFNRYKFVDKVVENKDSRALVDENGNILMLYTFVDKNTLVIASSDKALKEIMFRLTAGSIIR